MSETLERAAAVLREHRATHAVVVDSRSDCAVGVLSTLDLADALAAR
jgi:CBS domain-containing protein